MPPQTCLENDGYLSPAQKKQFVQQLARSPHIQRIAEIGLNGGHSAELFFNECKALKLFVSFDLKVHSCTSHAVEYFQKVYPDRFSFIWGNSLETVPALHQKNPDLTFDLIYIDGCHEFEWALGDLMNMLNMSHPNTLLWLDDVELDPLNGVGAAVRWMETLGRIEIQDHFVTEEAHFGVRSWMSLGIKR